jgi:hypothetical protein
MASDLPYAADAEVSLSYDELEVAILVYLLYLPGSPAAGIADTIPKGTRAGLRYCSNQVQLRMGTRQGSNTRPPG